MIYRRRLGPSRAQALLDCLRREHLGVLLARDALLLDRVGDLIPLH